MGVSHAGILRNQMSILDGIIEACIKNETELLAGVPYVPKSNLTPQASADVKYAADALRYGSLP
jgi:hypothetical protein